MADTTEQKEQNILLIGCTQQEPHVVAFKRRHTDNNVYTLDEQGTDSERHFLCDFNKPSEVYLFYQTVKERRLEFDQIIFDVDVIKFIGTSRGRGIAGEYVFQMLLIVFNMILKRDGRLFFECCTWGSASIDFTTRTLNFPIIAAVPTKYHQKVTLPLESDLSGRYNHPGNMSMIVEMIKGVLDDYGFHAQNISHDYSPYPLLTVDKIWRYIVAVKAYERADFIVIEDNDKKYYLGYSEKPELFDILDPKFINARAQAKISCILSKAGLDPKRAFLFGIDDNAIALTF